MSFFAKASNRQRAVRLLACLDAGSDPVTVRPWGNGVVSAMHGRAKLQAFDFWMRNPDYLANELLDELQADLRQWLSGNLPEAEVLTEITGLAGVRTDIYVGFGAHRFVI